MMNMETMMSLGKDDLDGAAKALGCDDIAKLVEWLSLKNEEVRYRAFLLLRRRSSIAHDVYPHWETFRSKLKSENSYQRSIGLILLGENAKWDAEGRMADTLDECLLCLNDEKPITIRQCVESLGRIAADRPELSGRIAKALIAMDLGAIKETMRKPILGDILHALVGIPRGFRADEAERFIQSALTGEMLDGKSKKLIESEWRANP